MIDALEDCGWLFAWGLVVFVPYALVRSAFIRREQRRRQRLLGRD